MAPTNRLTDAALVRPPYMPARGVDKNVLGVPKEFPFGTCGCLALTPQGR